MNATAETKTTRKAKTTPATAAKTNSVRGTGTVRAEQNRKPQPVNAWAMFGVIFTLILSAGLNGYANAQHAPVAFAGWLMGLAVPVLVLVLSKVAGEKFKSGNKSVAALAGFSGVSLLFLSVYHCANSIGMLTGSGLGLAIPMALAIDCGLVACEVAIITDTRGRRR